MLLGLLARSTTRIQNILVSLAACQWQLLFSNNNTMLTHSLDPIASCIAGSSDHQIIQYYLAHIYAIDLPCASPVPWPKLSSTSLSSAIRPLCVRLKAAMSSRASLEVLLSRSTSGSVWDPIN